MRQTFGKFLLVGGIAALVNWGSRFGFEPFMGLSAAVAAAYLVGMVTAYGLNRLFVFAPSGRRTPDEIIRFTIVNVFSLALVWAVTLGLARGLFPAIGFTWRPEAVAHAIGVLSPAAPSYFGHRHFTFSKAAKSGDGGPSSTRFRTIAGLGAWLQALRVHQWSKNLLIFVPIPLGLAIERPGAWVSCLAGFALMSMTASAGYLLNDLADLNADRRHRTKNARPLASGRLPIAAAVVVALVLLACAAVGSVFLSLHFAAVLAAYFATTLSYSLWLKRIPILDVMILACLYTLRLVAGIILAGVVGSSWLLTFSLFFFFSMSLAKRHVELSTATSPPGETMPGRGYRPSDAPLTLSLGLATSAAAILIIVQYLMAEAFPSGIYAFPLALWAAPFVIALWAVRIWLLAHRGELHDDPVEFAIKDRVSLGLGALLGIAFLTARLGIPL